MMYCIIIFIIVVYAKCGVTFWPSSYKVNLKNHETFVISLGNEVHDDETEIEMIQSDDFAQIQYVGKNSSRYEPLHSHVEHYNRRAADIEKEKSKNQPIDMTVVKETNIIEARPYFADFHNKIQQFDDKLRAQGARGKTTIDFAFSDKDQYEELKHTTLILGLAIGLPKSKAAHEEDQEDYNYDNFKAEYYQQLEDANRNNLTFNYTVEDVPESSPKDAIKKIVELKEPKNCTNEELKQFGLNAVQCLINDYKYAKKPADVTKILGKTWTVLKIWLCIYICIAIPCWCQKGWCCCCCRCEFCFPRRRIRRAKKYLALNPPGVFVQQPSKEQCESMINYQPSVLEIDAYEKLESKVRNL